MQTATYFNVDNGPTPLLAKMQDMIGLIFITLRYCE